MKRFLSFMMALALLFSMSVNAFAFEDGKGSITITNATVDNVYTLYKIFDASIAKDKDNNTVVAYSMEKTNQFYSYMFNEDGSAKEGNVYFVYNAVTGAVTLNSTVDTPEEEANMFAYLKTMVEAKKADNTSYEAVDTKTATSQEVKFENLPYGYYLIHKGSTAAVTIDSNTPDVEVIDKNQEVGKFEKWIWDEDKKEWTRLISSNVGDIETFKLEFDATNYDGEDPIKYYAVKDTNGDALWINIDEKITVTVGNDTLEKGYYYHVSENVDDRYLGEWDDVADEDKNIDDAEWYFVQKDDKTFEIVIPWMTNHNFEGTANGYDMSFNRVEGATPTLKYGANETVVINYNATVEYNANIGNINENLKNKAHLEWFFADTKGTSQEDVTNILVFALGVNKVSKETEEYLAGAEFEIYRDEACEDPVYVIPTGTNNVYIVDDLGTVNKGKDGESAREQYAEHLAAYLGDATQKNVVVTNEDGKITIIGLKEGTYFIKETKAPDGYNVLAGVTEIKVGAVVKEDPANTFYGHYATPVTVLNSKGIELPSTGGEGTMRMITIGSIVAIAFAVLLITNKKMSVYQD